MKKLPVLLTQLGKIAMSTKTRVDTGLGKARTVSKHLRLQVMNFIKINVGDLKFCHRISNYYSIHSFISGVSGRTSKRFNRF